MPEINKKEISKLESRKINIIMWFIVYAFALVAAFCVVFSTEFIYTSINLTILWICVFVILVTIGSLRTYKILTNINHQLHQQKSRYYPDEFKMLLYHSEVSEMREIMEELLKEKNFKNGLSKAVRDFIDELKYYERVTKNN